MSKSLGNLVLVRDLLRDHSGDAIRHYLVSQPLPHGGPLRRRCTRALGRRPPRSCGPPPHARVSLATGDAGTGARARPATAFLAALDDDLDTPSAMVELESLARLALETDDDALAAQAGALVRELGGRILGLRLATVPERSTVAA